MEAAKLFSYLGPFELLNEHATPRLLRYVRWGVYGLWMFKLLLDPLWRLAALPLFCYKPIGVLRLLSDEQRAELFSANGLTILWLVCFLLSGATFFPRCFAVAATLAAPALTLYSTVIRGYGEAIHTDVALLLSSWALPMFAWADIAIKKPEGDARWPLFTMVAFICTAYVLVGVNRLFIGGIQVFVGTSMEAYVVDASLRAYYFNTDIGWHAPEHPFLAFNLRAGFPFVTLMEILAPLVFIWPKFRWFFIPFMLVFHGLSCVFMNIFFFDDMLSYLLLIDWDRPLKPWMKQVMGWFFK